MVASSLKWHGGKYKIAQLIVDLMSPHRIYLEAYAGGLSVLMRKPCEGVTEYANDLNEDLTNFWRVLANPKRFRRFERAANGTPLSEPAWRRATKTSSKSDVNRALNFFVKIRQSRQGLGEDYCTPTRRQRRGMNENVSAWLSAVEGLPEVHERLKRVEVWNRPAVEAIRRLDCEDLLVYADPPYLHSTRSSTGEYGEHEMTPQQHNELLKCLARMQGRFMLSGYRSPMYDWFAEKYHWRRAEIDVANSASSAAVKERKIECIWMNYYPCLKNSKSKTSKRIRIV